MATRWIPAGVGVYIGFMVLAPRCHALGKQRGYMTISELIFDRYLPPHSKRTWVAHALRLGTFACLQLPIFTYLITQFQSVGSEVSAFTGNGITSQTAILVAAAVLFICDMMGGMRAVAYSDVIQGELSPITFACTCQLTNTLIEPEQPWIPTQHLSTDCPESPFSYSA